MLRIMKYLSKAEIGQMLIALVTIVGQVYFDLKLPDYMSDITTLVEKLKTQKGIVIDQQTIPGANHFFEDKLEPLMETVTGYLDMRLANVR